VKDERLLTTGQAARICSVTADTVLKWIRSGYLPARRTAGGHHRILEKDLDLVSMFRQREGSASGIDSESQAPLCSDDSGNPTNLLDCPAHILSIRRRENTAESNTQVWQVRPSRNDRCPFCDYFREVSQFGMNVLVVTQDPILSLHLKGAAHDNAFNLEITNSEYRCSVLVGEFKPEFVVIDSEIGIDRCREVGFQILNDPRIPFVEVIIAGAKEEFLSECRTGVFSQLGRPFDFEDIGNQISSFWYGRMTQDSRSTAIEAD